MEDPKTRSDEPDQEQKGLSLGQLYLIIIAALVALVLVVLLFKELAPRLVTDEVMEAIPTLHPAPTCGNEEDCPS